MNEGRLDIADVHADRDGTGPALGALLGVGDDPLAGKTGELFGSKIAFELLEA